MSLTYWGVTSPSSEGGYYHLYMYEYFPPLTESRSGIKQNKTDLDKSDTQEVVGGYYGVQHDAKELHVRPKRID